MSLFEKLPKNEVKMAESYIDNYAFENTSRSASMDYILRIWDSAKSEYLYRMLGNQFIISKPVEFVKDVEEMDSELENAFHGYDADSEVKDFLRQYRERVVDPMDRDRDEDWMRFDAVRSLVSSWSLARNIYEGQTCELVAPNGKTIKIQNGGKITRILGKIATNYELEGFERFRIVHSQILNQKRLKGTLCLSIHPLDYMTMSDNASDWSSCMSWQENGCYRQGTVEMMNSPMVVVAYLRGSEDMYMPGYNFETEAYNNHWVNKKWRQLFIVTPELITNIKAYPYRNDSLTAAVLDWLKELAATANIGEYTQQIVRYDAYRDFKVEEFNNQWYNIEPSTYQMYNDFSDDQFAYIGKAMPSGTFRFYYSGESECMACGSISCDFDGETMLSGTCCEEVYYCECCEDRYYDYDDLVELDGMMLCHYCYEEHCCEDAITGEIHHEDNMLQLHLAPNNSDHYFTDIAIDIYDDNFEPSMLTDYFKNVHKTYERYSCAYYVTLEDCTEKGLELFGFHNIEEFEECAKHSWKNNLAQTVEEITESWYELRDRWTSRDCLRLVFQIG